jgi:hypothetical protein
VLRRCTGVAAEEAREEENSRKRSGQRKKKGAGGEGRGGGASERQFAPTPLFITVTNRSWYIVILPTSGAVAARGSHVEEEGGATVQRSCHTGNNVSKFASYRGMGNDGNNSVNPRTM